MQKRKLMGMMLAISVIAATTGCTKIDNGETLETYHPAITDAPVATSTEEVPTATEPEATTEPTSEDATISVVAVGDNLVQTKVYESAADHATDGENYNFGYCYENVEDAFDGDLNVINQETLICDDENEISGSDYNFNSPAELGDAVTDMGFNLVTLCNNHVLDKGESGLSDCLDYWDGKMAEDSDLLACGVYRGDSDVDNIRTITIKGKKIAVLSYTENTNGYSLSDTTDLRIIYTEEEDVIQKQIEEAKEIADVVLVTCHWGVEDTYEVTEGVQDLAQKIINWGADVIIGTHPHVPQTMEYITRDDGTQGFVFYSLGNFISAQTWNINSVGEIADFDICVSGEGDVTIENVKVSPVVSQYESGLSNLRVYAYENYSEELANEHGSLDGSTYNAWGMDTIREVFENAVPDEFLSWEY